eukprot:TRINITY_DN19578_c0_g1::TRINITY_DN19578_c0_g1_i1::g.24490::m.24490 TRINITY_DN19578_c0_g1::TRINITY_DN19578_c0_g1_i1::g.24490  ORF type:complete len:396 (+),score=90.88,sp/P32289/GLNA_VIGAC/64.90/3e-167,Gln-synt_C/PF00120.19/1.2e-59,Gln-synt_N/PF03951.14/1.4e-16 TRINITY_DN19578_c0_g1_i1:73-1188(+)
MVHSAGYGSKIFQTTLSDPLDLSIQNQFFNLPQGDKIQAEYVWLGGLSDVDLRSKTRTLDKAPQSIDELPIWNYDGSSTGQAPGNDSEVMIKPARIYKDPFRGGNNILVLCDTYLPDGEPHPMNTRYECVQIMDRAKAQKPWFGLEQEYTLYRDSWPLGWPKSGYPGPQGPYYCGAGADKAFGRPIVEAHYRACLYAGIMIAGSNGEVMPGQWEFQIGPAEGIQAGDDLWMSRYIMERICEVFNVTVSYEPKPIPGDWNGAGCHTNYSTEEMRNPGGYDVILKAIEKLGKRHAEHIAVYGSGNELRLTGRHETAPIDRFCYGIANRGASVRIPRDTAARGFGYFEDRRPASNMDPWLVTSIIVETTCLLEL